jgi:hypothetical protein
MIGAGLQFKLSMLKHNHFTNDGESQDYRQTFLKTFKYVKLLLLNRHIHWNPL